MAQDHFNDLRQALSVINGVAASLFNLSDSFEKTGNDKLAEKLYLLGEILDNQVEAVVRIDSARTKEQVDESWKSTGEMLGLISKMVK